MELNGYEVVFKVEGIKFKSDLSKIKFENQALPLIKMIYFNQYNEVANLLNPHYEKWNKELKDVSIEQYNVEIRKRQMKIVDKYNKQHNSCISMDIDEENMICGHIKDLLDSNNKIYFVLRDKSAYEFEQQKSALQKEIRDFIQRGGNDNYDIEEKHIKLQNGEDKAIYFIKNKD